MTTPFPKPCGRLDRHDEHDWTRPLLMNNPARTYRCHGRVLVEGGYWADWDAADDEREEREIRERRETA